MTKEAKLRVGRQMGPCKADQAPKTRNHIAHTGSGVRVETLGPGIRRRWKAALE